MHKNVFWKKGLVLGIIFLFVGVGVYPAVAIESESSLNNKQSESELDIFIIIKSGNRIVDGIERLLGCYCLVGNREDESVNISVIFNVTSYSLKGEFLGLSTKFTNNFLLTANSMRDFHILPEYYGELITWVKATATVEVNNGEITCSEIGISIGKWIHFFWFLT